MDRIKRLFRLTWNDVLQLAGSIASIIGLAIAIKLENYWLAGVLFTVIVVAVILTSREENATLRAENTNLTQRLANSTKENEAFKYAAEQFHKINHDYRDILCEMFSGSKPKTDKDELRRFERRILESVCQKVEKIFRKFIEADCMVTVKYITKTDESMYCETHVRSETLSERDRSRPTRFVIKDGENSAFDMAIRVSPGTVSHFYSTDLTREEGYRNQRSDWKRFYLSTIVVPIRYVNPQKSQSDDIGFLTVDTMATNRLNNTYHVQYLAALADQMYNFMSLMRGTYSVHPATDPLNEFTTQHTATPQVK
jgi:hypothetical protein